MAGAFRLLHTAKNDDVVLRPLPAASRAHAEGYDLKTEDSAESALFAGGQGYTPSL